MSLAGTSGSEPPKDVPRQEEIDAHLEVVKEKNADGMPTQDALRSARWLGRHEIPIPDDEDGQATLKIFPKGDPKAPGQNPPATSPTRMSLHAELGVLGCMAADTATIPAVVEVLRAEDLCVEAHRILFRTLVDQHGEGKPATRAHLEDALTRIGQEEPQREELLAKILDAGVDVAQARGLAELVAQKSYERSALEVGERVMRLVKVGKLSGSELAARIEEVVSPLLRIEAYSDWQEPALEASVPVEAFPLDVFPRRLVELIHDAARCIPCAPDFLAVPIMTLAGVAIGKSVALRIKEGWSEIPNLFTAIVGRPGTAKSPALTIATRPIWRVQEEMMTACILSREEHEKRKRQRDAERRVKGACLLSDDEDLALPALQEIVVSDTTREAVGELLFLNPRGVMMVRDELSGFINALGQYKGGDGDDREFYMSLWNGAPVKTNRKGKLDGLPVYVRLPFFGATGALTPSKLYRLPQDASGRTRDDGFMDRFFYSYPDEVADDWTWDSVAPGPLAAWTAAFKRLQNRPMALDDLGQGGPTVVAFDGSARKAWEAWIIAHKAETRHADFPREELEGPWKKMQSGCARLALVLDQLRWAYNCPHDDTMRDVTGTSVEGAARLIDYFKSHFRRVIGSIQGTKGDNRHARDMLEWLLNRAKPRFTERDVNDVFRVRFKDHPEYSQEALDWLTKRHCIRRLPSPPKSRGRTPSQGFEINPRLFSDPRMDPRNPRYSGDVGTQRLASAP
jgi:hypothetical protein